MTKEKLQHNFYFIMLAIMTIAGLFLLSPYADVLFVAVMFAILFKPMHKGILRAFKGRKTLSALVSTATVMLVVLVPLGFFGYQIFIEAKDLYVVIADSDLQTNGTAGIGTALQRYVPQIAPTVSANIGQYVTQGLQWVVTHLSTVFSSAVSVVVNFLLILFTLFFLFRDAAMFKKMILAISPLQDVHNEELLNKVELAIGSVTKGTIIVSLLQGILTGIGFTVVGIPNPMLWASIATFAAMIPAVGTGLIIAPAVLFLFVTGHTIPAVVLAAWGVGVVGTVDNIVRPALIGKGINIHPLLILFSALGGLKFFGIIGFFVGPVVLAVLSALYEMYPRIIRNHADEMTSEG